LNTEYVFEQIFQLYPRICQGIYITRFIYYIKQGGILKPKHHIAAWKVKQGQRMEALFINLSIYLWNTRDEQAAPGVILQSPVVWDIRGVEAVLGIILYYPVM
jgi:hypothetical protein